MKPSARSIRSRVALVIVLFSLGALLSSQTAPREQVGPLAAGGFLLNSGWRLQPVGKQIALDTLPMSSVVTPDGKYMLVLNCGYKPPSISVIDLATGAVTGSAPVPDAWLGLAISPKGDRVYASGGSHASVFEYSLTNGTLASTREFPVVDAARRAPQDFIGDVTFDREGRLLYAAELFNDAIAVINPQSGIVIAHIKTGRRPYRILFHPDGKSFFVTHWADGTVGQYDISNGNQLMGRATRIGAHPTDMVWRPGGPAETAEGESGYAARLFVAAANTNNVYSVGVSAGKELNVVESINIAMTARQPLGMTPSALALSPDNNRLYVACSDGNVAAVVDIAAERSRVLGFIPTGWYPTGVRALPSGALVVLNGKGVSRLQTGTASWIDPFTASQLDQWTQAAMANSPYRDSQLDVTSPLPSVQHVIYIVTENGAYDQVLGDMKEGNGDPKLTVFGESATPNLHKLAREFVLLDNFYVNAEAGADGQSWSTSAIGVDYIQKLWPNSYANRRKTSDYEEQDPASLPPAGYLWSNANAAGLSIRNFGYMAANKQGAKIGEEQIAAVRDPVLAKYTNRFYRGFDLDYPDAERAKVFLAEFRQYEQSGEMPRLIVMRMASDRTNDQGVGMIAEAVSKSKFWTSTAIFIVEADAQNGPDHVDSHRSPAFVISPFIKRHTVDSAMYNTTSVLRTMELMLGLKPMTQFDASARIVTAPFQSTPDPAPYTFEKPRIPLADKNLAEYFAK
jgi:YVTN family beta-propeller protein